MSRVNRQESTGERVRRLEGDVRDLRALVSARTGYLLRGTGSPEGEKAAPVGTLYLQTDGAAGTVLWVKESGGGTTGWVAK